MGKHCTSCGNPVPAGQFRCGRCGAPQEDEETETLEGEAEAEAEPRPSAAAQARAPGDEPDESAEPGPSLVQSAVSLPPPAPDEDALEVDHGEADASDSGRRSDPVEAFEREEDTDKRKAVPKGAFGEGSVVDKLPTASSEGEARSQPQPAPAEARTSEATGKVARLKGLEPTRHAGDDAPDEEQAPQAQAEAQAETDDGEADGEPDSAETPLELDVPSGGLRSLPHKPRPPFLASELMRGEIIPERPGAHSIARMAQASGVLAVIAYGLLSVARPEASAWGAPALALLALGVAGLSYVQRAAGLAVLALATLGACAGAGFAPGSSSLTRLLPFVVLWLSGSLLLRFWYRGHRQPPWLVAVGVLGAAALGVAALGAVGPWVLSGHWQSWLLALTALGFAQLCLLSLFAFMGPETNAAGATWALAWWGWYAAAHVIFALAQATPHGQPLTLVQAADALMRSGLIAVFVMPCGAFALAQLYAVALSRDEPAAADDAHITPA